MEVHRGRWEEAGRLELAEEVVLDVPTLALVDLSTRGRLSAHVKNISDCFIKTAAFRLMEGVMTPSAISILRYI